MFRRYVVVGTILLGTLVPAIRSQEAVPLANGPNWKNDTGKPLDVEVIEIGRFGAMPRSIERPKGKFILVLVNKSPGGELALHLDRGDVPEKVLGSNPMFHLEGPVTTHKRRVAIGVDLPPGEFHLKLGSTAETLCTIKGK